jgi:glutathione peroxidase
MRCPAYVQGQGLALWDNAMKSVISTEARPKFSPISVNCLTYPATGLPYRQDNGESMTGIASRPLPAKLLPMAAFWLILALAALLPLRADAGYTFPSIDGGTIDLDAFRGKPVLVVNTASLCGFTPQYDDLQVLYDTYKDRGLVVLAVPSDDFSQELADNAEVKTFCAVNFGLTIPMTTITPVTGGGAHPFYAMLRDSHGFEPEWNFNKVLIGPDGAVIDTWGSLTKPTAAAITDPIEALLN